MKSNLGSKNSNDQLVIENHKIYKTDLSPFTISDFYSVENALFAYFHSRGGKITEEQIHDKYLLKLLETSTLHSIKEQNEEEIKKTMDRNTLINTKLDIKSLFLYRDNPLILKENHADLNKQIARRNSFCWKCDSPILLTDVGRYNCPNCGFNSYIQNKSSLEVFDEAEYCNKNINRETIFIDYSHFNRLLESFNVNMEQYNKELERVSVQNKPIPSLDIILTFINNLIILYMNRGSFEELSSLYSSLAFFFWKTGLYFYEFQYNAILCQLYELKEQGCQNVKIGSSCNCENCKKFDGTELPINIAIKTMPIPNRKCRNIAFDYDDPERFLNDGLVLGLCNCNYTNSVFNFDISIKKEKKVTRPLSDNVKKAAEEAREYLRQMKKK